MRPVSDLRTGLDLPTVWREDGFRVAIFVDDHMSAHVHVLGDGEAKINLNDLGLVWARGLSRGEPRRASRRVDRRRADLLVTWNEFHG